MLSSRLSLVNTLDSTAYHILKYIQGWTNGRYDVQALYEVTQDRIRTWIISRPKYITTAGLAQSAERETHVPCCCC